MFDFFYPSNLGFGFALGSLALLLGDRHLLAGIALGLATLLHPQVGSLMLIAFAPVALVAGGRLDLRAAALFAIPVVVLGAPSVIQLVFEQNAGGSLSPHEKYELIAVVRTRTTSSTARFRPMSTSAPGSGLRAWSHL